LTRQEKCDLLIQVTA